MSYPIPDTEQLRLAVLEELEVLDSPRSPEFEELVLQIAQYFDVDAALITLMDEHRQWFKSEIGLGIRETSREISFCAYTIMANEVYIVEDATQDELFASNSLVTGSPRIRMYAGAPITLQYHDELVNIGTVAIISQTPRKLRHGQRLMLQNFSRLAALYLQLERIGQPLLPLSSDWLGMCSWCPGNRLTESFIKNLAMEFASHFTITHIICEDCTDQYFPVKLPEILPRTEPSDLSEE